MKQSLFIICVLLLTACRSVKTVPVVTNTISYDTLLVNQVLHDSVYVGHDRLQKMLGDTMYIRDSITVYRVIAKRDTVTKVQEVQKVKEVPVEVVKEVARKRNWFDWVCYGVTGLLVIGIILVLLKRLSVF